MSVRIGVVDDPCQKKPTPASDFSRWRSLTAAPIVECDPQQCSTTSKVKVMGRASQSQDVEHQGPKTNPLDSRKRQARGPSDRLRQEGSRQEAKDDSNLSQHGPHTSSRPD